MKQFEIALEPEEAAINQDFRGMIVSSFNIPSDQIKAVKLVKRAIDARNRRVKIRFWIDVYFTDDNLPIPILPVSYKDVRHERPVFIVGCGPAGMFAALKLIEHGLKPVIIEQGKDVRTRRRDLAILNKTGLVNPFSNYCFGEGGAGTYSDGKLYTRSTKRGDVNRILQIFNDHGASSDILIDAHPHIGTNKLPQVISSIRETIINYGGEIYFNTALKELIIENKKIKGIKVLTLPGIQVQESVMEGDALILATGHSARNIFEMLYEQQVKIEAKPFAIGVRIEHPQSVIDSQQYHCDSRGGFLPPASYNLTFQGRDKSLYSFCMCPGGIIAPAATGGNEIVVNGWSPSKRNNPYANSGMVVNVDEKDFLSYRSSGDLAALRFQQYFEKEAFKAGGGLLKAPAQRLVDFTENKLSAALPGCSYIPGVTSCQLSEVLPAIVYQTLREGFKFFGSRMKGFFTNDALVVGVESRTSSPVRIPRDKETLMHPDISGFFPCGEGAGYAGGIVSAAIDGQRCADQCAIWLS